MKLKNNKNRPGSKIDKELDRGGVISNSSLHQNMLLWEKKSHTRPSE
jgi:hypothetical protein